MGTYVLIRKVSETDLDAVYEFGPNELEVGRFRINKGNGEVELLQPVPKERAEFYFQRAMVKILQHFKLGEMPDRTCFAS
jgi:hypothetical protein